MALTPANNRQVPSESIMDRYGKQVYLGNQFGIALGNVTVTGTAEVPLWLLLNSATSGKALFIVLKKLAGVTAGDTAILRSYINPTVTANGTTQSILNLRPASPLTPVAQAFTGSTVTANGTFVDALSVGVLNTSESDQLLVLDPGVNMLLTAQVNATSTIAALLNWYEL
jgi:hypothetical protein